MLRPQLITNRDKPLAPLLTTHLSSDGILNLRLGDASPFEAVNARRRQRERFARARKAENWYSIQLRKIARQIGDITKGYYNPNDPATVTILQDMLKAYSKIIKPWANAIGTKMIADVARRDENAWRELSREMGQALQLEIRTAPTGSIMRALLDEQVNLITSLPLDAAKRVHELTLANIVEGGRGENIVDMIMRTGEVSKNRAILIARTETSRTAAVLTEARAKHIGSEGYIWRTAHDADVRPLHKKLEGKFIYWNDPPVAGSQGEKAHAGCIYNCRCYPEVILPERS